MSKLTDLDLEHYEQTGLRHPQGFDAQFLVVILIQKICLQYE